MLEMLLSDCRTKQHARAPKAAELFRTQRKLLTDVGAARLMQCLSWELDESFNRL